MTDFNLTAAVRAVIDETDLADPRDVAAKVAANVPSKYLRAALAEALATYVRVQFGRDRMSTPRIAAPEVPEQPVANRSAKVAAFREHAEAWRKKLRDRVSVGGGRWELLADCSYDHLVYAAMERRQQAAANAVAADRYEQRAAAMKAAGVDRFGDLPDDVLRSLLSDDSEAAA